jgi:hypothetical protein
LTAYLSTIVSGLKIKNWIGQSFRLLLLLLFLGYYGGITFFTHAHIVNGITIVHSHPYKPVKGADTSNLQHTGKEIIIIQLLTKFITTAFALLFSILILRLLLFKLAENTPSDGYAEPGGFCNYSLRAPPQMWAIRIS